MGMERAKTVLVDRQRERPKKDERQFVILGITHAVAYQDLRAQGCCAADHDSPTWFLERVRVSVTRVIVRCSRGDVGQSCGKSVMARIRTS